MEHKKCENCIIYDILRYSFRFFYCVRVYFCFCANWLVGWTCWGCWGCSVAGLRECEGLALTPIDDIRHSTFDFRLSGFVVHCAVKWFAWEKRAERVLCLGLGPSSFVLAAGCWLSASSGPPFINQQLPDAAFHEWISSSLLQMLTNHFACSLQLQLAFDHRRVLHLKIDRDASSCQASC